MSRRSTGAAFLLALACAPACAPRNPPLDFAFDHAARFGALETYAWLADPSSKAPRGNAVVDGPFLDRNVRARVDAVLRAKGYRKIESGDPSFYVAFRLDAAGFSSQDKYAVSGASGGIWLGDDHTNGPQNEQVQPGAGGRPNATAGYSGTEYQKRETLVLDIRDADRALVWRGARTTKAGTNPDAIARDIDDSVRLLLAKFPPPPSE